MTTKQQAPPMEWIAMWQQQKLRYEQASNPLMRQGQYGVNEERVLQSTASTSGI